jgi:hypothetical protein
MGSDALRGSSAVTLLLRSTTAAKASESKEINMKNTLRYSCLLVLIASSLATVCVAQPDLCIPNPAVPVGPNPPGLQAAPWYFLWRAGNPGDQSTVPGQHSGLVTWIGPNLDDVQFANLTKMRINANQQAYGAIPLVYAFGECFGGGMIDELDAAIAANPISIVTAAFFNQRAIYPEDAGNHMDFMRAYINAILASPNISAQGVAAQASADDPWGWNGKPNPPRSNLEILGAETPEYYSKNNGDHIDLERDPSEVNSVIIWAGQPELEDDHQAARLILALVDLGFDPENIVALFASGRPANSPDLVSTMQALYKFDPPAWGQSHLRPATRAEFDNVLKSWALPRNPFAPINLYFFISLDHGCNNAWNQAFWLKGGHQTPPIIEGGNWGSYGGSSNPVYPAHGTQ